MIIGLVIAGGVGHRMGFDIPKQFVKMPSLNEGLPVSLIEAQASGMVCIVSTGVPKEVNVTGNVMFLPLDVSSWKNAVVDYINNRPTRDFFAITQVEEAGYSIENASKSLMYYYGVQK